ncbi:hypothetical protein MRBBS_1651 [Marinobacter sp. BSs20148]|nr:hypothetical protein MRBBS_1651 [Marinobacter sp. BSs20148]
MSGECLEGSCLPFFCSGLGVALFERLNTDIIERFLAF